jgi:hypothetical protein
MFATIADYEIFVYSLCDTFPVILTSTLRVIRSGPDAGQVIGTLTFANDIRLDVAEQVDFDTGSFEILQYGYVVWQGSDRLYWYDSQSHPNDPSLASTDPHHKHIPPDIKHHRIPAPQMSLVRPNLPVLIAEIESLLAKMS